MSVKSNKVGRFFTGLRKKEASAYILLRIKSIFLLFCIPLASIFLFHHFKHAKKTLPCVVNDATDIVHSIVVRILTCLSLEEKVH